jgi:hypothetical protein
VELAGFIARTSYILISVRYEFRVIREVTVDEPYEQFVSVFYNYTHVLFRKRIETIPISEYSCRLIHRRLNIQEWVPAANRGSELTERRSLHRPHSRTAFERRSNGHLVMRRVHAGHVFPEKSPLYPALHLCQPLEHSGAPLCVIDSTFPT